MNFCIFVPIRSYIAWASSSRPYSAIRYVGAACGGPQKNTKKQRTAKGGPYNKISRSSCNTETKQARAHTVRPYNCLSLFIALFTHFTCSSGNAEGGVPYRSLTMKKTRALGKRPYNCLSLFIALFTHFTCSLWNAEGGVPNKCIMRS